MDYKYEIIDEPKAVELVKKDRNEAVILRDRLKYMWAVSPNSYKEICSSIDNLSEAIKCFDYLHGNAPGGLADKPKTNRILNLLKEGGE